ncbi:hypothetical protein M422DRAFT_35244 [Sphaerobolus stellatus SS14]|uniref:Uncharacterized protein n=1 Tax=Sphaerobolus stellatus (strain SS14) TaxID=990650 RepID=A0A0C9V9W0_SPHS4|nr:hypothetical protein M422DRAFT_35244 [Sphaerobolus stellatus SS14]
MIKLYLKGYTVDERLFQEFKGHERFNACCIFMRQLPPEERRCIDVVYHEEGNLWPILTRAGSNNREELEHVSIAPLNSKLRVAFKVKILSPYPPDHPMWESESIAKMRALTPEKYESKEEAAFEEPTEDNEDL